MHKSTTQQIIEFQKQEQQLETAITQAPLAFLKLYVDGTLVFVSDDGFRSLGIDLRAGLAKQYQEQFSDSPELVHAIEQAFQGNPIRDTVRVNKRPTDVRFFPAYDSHNRLAGVVGLLTDATSRFTAVRLFRTLEILSLIRKHLARSDSTEEFLLRTCEVAQEIYSAVWIGLAERSGKKSIRVITGGGPTRDYFSAMDLSWDISQKTGRNIAAEAIRSSRTQVTADLTNSVDCQLWHDGAHEYGWKSILAVPLLTDGISTGVLTIHNSGDGFDKEEISLWEKIGAEISEGISILEEREERKRMLLDRQEVDEKYKQLVESLFDVTVVHRDGKVLDINAAGVRLAGAQTREQLIGAPFVTLIDPNDRRRVLDSFTGDDPSKGIIEFKLLTLESSMIEVEGITVPVRHNGAPALLSVLRDISERKRQEQQLSKAKASLEYAQEIAKMGSIEYDVVSGRTEWSPSALAILDLAGDAAVKLESFIEIMSRRVVDKNKTAITSLVDDIRKHAKPSSAEFRIESDNAGVKTIQIYGIPEVEKRVFVPRIFFVVQDVTESRRAELGLKETTDRLLRAQEIGRIGDFEILLSNKQVILSPGACRILDLGKAHEISLESFYRQIHQDDQIILKNHIDAIADTGDGSASNEKLRFSVDTRLALQQGEQWISVQAEIVGIGKDRRIVGNIQDITERKKIEISVKRAKEEVDAAQRLARVWRWEFDVEAQRVTWEETIRELIGEESPITHMSYDQFLFTIRDIDRDAMRRAVDLSIKEGVPGSVVYVQKFLRGASFRMWARWRPEYDARGKVVKLRGASLDVSEVREAQEREARKERIHNKTGIPEKEMAYDRICYLVELAKRYGARFSTMAVRVHAYREIREKMGENSFYAAQIEVAKGVRRDIPHVDLYARLYKGRFLLVFSQMLSNDEVTKVQDHLTKAWLAAFAMQDYAHPEPVRISFSCVHCPDDGLDWEALLKLLEHRLEQASTHTV